jgi:hypothetical protein
MSMVIAELPPEERATRYREMAEETHTLATRADNPQVKSAYLELAGRWLALAQSSERMIAAEKRTIDPDEGQPDIRG